MYQEFKKHGTIDLTSVVGRSENGLMFYPEDDITEWELVSVLDSMYEKKNGRIYQWEHEYFTSEDFEKLFEAATGAKLHAIPEKPWWHSFSFKGTYDVNTWRTLAKYYRGEITWNADVLFSFPERDDIPDQTAVIDWAGEFKDGKYLDALYDTKRIEEYNIK